MHLLVFTTPTQATMFEYKGRTDRPKVVWAVGHSGGTYSCSCTDAELSRHRSKSNEASCKHLDLIKKSKVFEGVARVCTKAPFGTRHAELIQLVEPQPPMADDIVCLFGAFGEGNPSTNTAFLPPYKLDYEGVPMPEYLEAWEEKGISYAGEVGTLSQVSANLRHALAREAPLDSGKGLEGSYDPSKRIERSMDVKVSFKGVNVEKSWLKAKRPKDFYVAEDVWECALYAAHAGINALFTGPTGSGKSTLVDIVTRELDIPLHPFNFGGMQHARISLIGNTHFSPEAGTFFKESRFVKALQEEGQSVILLDELSRAPQDAPNILLPLLDDQGYLAIDESEEAQLIPRQSKTAFFATANIGSEYTGTMQMDRALVDRFAMKIDLDFPPDSEESALLKTLYDRVEGKFINLLVKTAWDQRQAARDEMLPEISTRMLKDCCAAVHEGVPPEFSIRHTILGCFSPSGGEASVRATVEEFFVKNKLFNKGVNKGFESKLGGAFQC